MHWWPYVAGVWQMLRWCILGAVLLVSFNASAATYYIDWSAGNDANNGTATGTPWKHAPGDDNATGNANITLAAGDTAVFKGGVTYQGTATVTDSVAHRRVLTANATGTVGNIITFISGNVHVSAWGSGRAILDGTDLGAGAAKSGFYAKNRQYISVVGLEIQNIGVNSGGTKIADSAGVECENQTGVGGGLSWAIQSNKIHDINWSGSYTIGYGVEINHCTSTLIEKNEIYNASDKLVEIASDGLDGSIDSAYFVIRQNILHNAAVHCVTLTGYAGAFYDNLIWQCNDGTIIGGGGTPNPGYCMKVGKGSSNQIYNNICYDTSAGFGVLIGRNNVIAHNIIYGVGLNGSGTHGGNDEACLSLFNNDNAWGAASVSGNLIYNNICYYIPNANTASEPKMIFYNQDGGSGNLVKNNVLFALAGDTTATGNRARSSNATSGSGGTDTYRSIASFEANFNSDFGGSGNVASGNVAVDPAFVGGILGSLANLPTSFNSTYTDVNTSSFWLSSGSPAQITGITLASPYNADLRGVGRPPFWPGPYVDTVIPVPGNSGTITTASVTSSSMTLNWTKATDDVSQQNTLQYEVCRSTSNNVTSVAQCEAATIVGQFATDIATFNSTGLAASTSYYFNVVVEDQAGNKATYTPVNQTTSSAGGSAGAGRSRIHK